MYNVKESQVVILGDVYMKHIGYKTDGYYVEVGGYNGVAWSNTLGLAKIGWSGLIFEPQDFFFKQCVDVYKNMPQIKVEKCCVGSYNGQTDLFIGGPLTTTSSKMVEIYKTLGWSERHFRKINKVRSSIYTLDHMLEKHNWPVGFDVLVVDTEGTELDVLKGFSIDKWRPRMMILELCEKHPDKALLQNVEEINDMLTLHKYEKIYADIVNSIFILSA